jgi:tellurite resistance protein TerC
MSWPVVDVLAFSSMFWLYAGFVAFILGALALDLGVFHREAHAVKAREALIWTAIWAGVALLFAIAIWFLYENHICGLGLCAPSNLGGTDASLLYLQAYLVEKSLSIDNMFVIALIFTHFGTPPAYQHRVLFWGVLGALVMRGVLIAAGAALLQRFEWMMYVFGGLLLLTAFKMWWDKDAEAIHPDKTWIIRLARRFYPVSGEYDRQHFFTRLANGTRALTPLALVLLSVEVTDLIFAVDSIPACFSITTDPFLVFTSNVFAILGLRSLFFAINDLMTRLHYMKICLIILLAVIGMKMLIHKAWKPPTWASLAAIVFILGAGVYFSLRKARKDDAADAATGGGTGS